MGAGKQLARLLPHLTTLPLTLSPHRRQLSPAITHHQEQDEAEAGVEC